MIDLKAPLEYVAKLVADALQKERDLTVIDVSGVKYMKPNVFTRVPLESERQLPVAATMKLQTLIGLVEFWRYRTIHEPGSTASDLFVVGDEVNVYYYSAPLGFEQKRTEIGRAWNQYHHQFGNKIGLEEFGIWLRSSFVDSQDRKDLLQILGNVTDGNVKTVVDNGVAQEVNIKLGAAFADNGFPSNKGLIKPVWKLTPYRTFMEVEQVESEFVVRLHAGKDGAMPTISLHEADGGRWQDEAMKRVATWLRTEVAGGITVVG